jgi:hypothetical protein
MARLSAAERRLLAHESSAESGIADKWYREDERVFRAAGVMRFIGIRAAGLQLESERAQPCGRARR